MVGITSLSTGMAKSARRPAWEQILTLASADGWTALYDPTNPNTRTLRESGGDQFLTEIADSLGSLPALVQATTANQPQLSIREFGSLAAGLGNGMSSVMQTGSLGDNIPSPYTLVVVGRFDNTDNQRMLSWAANQMFMVSEEEWQISATTELDGVAADTSEHVFTCIYNGGSSKLIIDGSTVLSGDTGGGLFSGFTWLGRDAMTAVVDGAGGPFSIRADADETRAGAMADLLHLLTRIPQGS